MLTFNDISAALKASGISYFSNEYLTTWDFQGCIESHSATVQAVIDQGGNPKNSHSCHAAKNCLSTLYEATKDVECSHGYVVIEVDEKFHPLIIEVLETNEIRFELKHGFIVFEAFDGCNRLFDLVKLALRNNACKKWKIVKK